MKNINPLRRKLLDQLRKKHVDFDKKVGVNLADEILAHVSGGSPSGNELELPQFVKRHPVDPGP